MGATTERERNIYQKSPLWEAHCFEKRRGKTKDEGEKVKMCKKNQTAKK
jgi:hypothetical protein